MWQEGSSWRINCFVRAVDFVALLARDFKLLDREFQCGKMMKSFLGRSFDIFSKLVSGSSGDGKEQEFPLSRALITTSPSQPASRYWGLQPSCCNGQTSQRHKTFSGYWIIKFRKSEYVSLPTPSAYPRKLQPTPTSNERREYNRLVFQRSILHKNKRQG